MEEEVKTKSVQRYSDLEVWKHGIELVQKIYELTKSFPQSEIYGLTSQIRRSSVSVPANIAEGWGRRKTKAFVQFLSISSGSLYELETLLIIAGKQNYINNETLEKLLNEIEIIGKMLNSLIHKLQI
jgi:four helix bundle protein